ncbi:MAG: FAD-dependent oxidoreductase [Cellulomonas sp.]|nr:FAD-dependent oxidoreductase [Actinomycetota bacterium]MCG2799954.1 FAD-dependent oxidoreductase [Cellulomonas sp.]
MSRRRLVVVGGVAGGMSAAARARRLDETLEIVVLEAGPYVSFANCGLPYHLSNDIPSADFLLLHDPQSLAEDLALDVRIDHRVTAIDRAARIVTVVSPQGEEQIGYDALVLSPGAVAVEPPIEGLHADHVHHLRTVPDVKAIAAQLDGLLADNPNPVAVVVGAGFIGLEAVEALVSRGVTVHLVELAPQVLPPLDAELAARVAAELTLNGVQLHLGVSATSVDPQVVLSDGTTIEADLVLVNVGVRPATTLAADAGLELGVQGAIVVDQDQRTSDEHIWAAGDAVQVSRYGLTAPGVVPLAGPASRQGRRAADSICGHRTTPQAPVLGTAIVRVFGLTAAVTGLSQRQLAQSGTPHEVVRVHSGNHVGWLPGSQIVHLVASFAPDGTLLGAQAVGSDGVDKRIDVLATAIRSGMGADDLAELELAYAPPYGAAKDPVNMLGFAAQNALDGMMPQWQPSELDAVLADELVLDVRTKREWDRGHLDGALLVPNTEVRDRLEEIREAAAGRRIAVHCASGFRSYLATRILLQAGLQARNLSGGWMTLSVARPEVLAPTHV